MMALNAYINILLVVIEYQISAFNIRCPNHLERYLRSKALCTDARNYTCLFDENKMSYSESCFVKFDFQRPGYRVTLRTNLHAEACPENLYQPVIFFTNESSNCEFKQSFCRKEGQIVSRNGTIKTNRQCRCNYADGYTFVTKPKDVCSCVPSVEDCSCYRKQCSKNHILSPDYQCIDKFTWLKNFTCSSISDVRIPNVTVSSNNISTEHIQRDFERKEKLTLKFLLCLILSVILLLVICSSIAIIIEDNNTGFDTSLNMLMARTEHAERDNKIDSYFETNDMKTVMEKLAATNCILLWGKPGCGKTTALCEIAHYYENDLGYQLITCYKPSDIFDQQFVTEKRIYVIDDIFGRFVFSYEKFVRLKECEKHFKNFFEENTVKLLMTCSSVAFRTDSVQEFSLFTNNAFELTRTSLPPNNKDTDSKNVQKVSKQTKLHPSDIRSKVETLRKSNNVAWCCLFICILKQGCIDEADLTSDDDHVFNELMGNVCNKLNIDISRQQFRKHLLSLMGTFIKKENRLFSITQTSVFEVLAVYFGQELQQLLIQFADPEIITQHCCLTSCPDFHGIGMFRIQVNEENEDLYFLRMKDQLRRKYLSEVFSVKQMDSELYRKRLAVFLKNLEPDDLKQINNSTCRIRSETALTLTSKYVNLSKILFEAKE